MATANLAVKIWGHTFKNPVIPAAGPNVGSGEMIRRAAEGGAGGLLAKTISGIADSCAPPQYGTDRQGQPP